MSKEKNQFKKLKGALTDAVRSGKLKGGQIKKLKRGLGASYSVGKKLRHYEKQLKQLNPETKEYTETVEKIRILKEVFECAKKEDIEGMRKLGSEYDKKWPGDF